MGAAQTCMPLDAEGEAAGRVVLAVTAIDTAAIIVGGLRFIVATQWIVASGNFIRFTHAVSVCVEVAVAVAIERIKGEFAAAVFVCGVRIVVTGAVIGASANFKFVADSVAVEVV